MDAASFVDLSARQPEVLCAARDQELLSSSSESQFLLDIINAKSKTTIDAARPEGSGEYYLKCGVGRKEVTDNLARSCPPVAICETLLIKLLSEGVSTNLLKVIQLA